MITRARYSKIIILSMYIFLFFEIILSIETPRRKIARTLSSRKQDSERVQTNRMGSEEKILFCFIPIRIPVESRSYARELNVHLSSSPIQFTSTLFNTKNCFADIFSPF